LKALAWAMPIALAAMVALSPLYSQLANAQNDSTSSGTSANNSGKTIITTEGNKTVITTPGGQGATNNSTASSSSSGTQQPQQPQQQQQTPSTSSQSSGGVVKSNFNRTGFTGVSNLIINGKSFPVKYNITNGKVLGLVADNDKATIVTVLGSQGDNGKLTIELPRNVIDAKGQGNKDAKFVVRIDDKGIDYKEIANSLKARILQIDFGKDDRVVEFTGTQTAS
jgi:hypothetical protein